MGELTRKTFYRPVDRRSKTAMTEFLENHFRYDTANGWNRSTSYACNMKLYNLGLPRAMEDKLFDMLEVPEFYEPINQLRQDFAEAHNYLWQTGFNGRSGGYLVLYQGGCRSSSHRSYCTRCGQRNFTSVSETGTRCGRCGERTRVDFKQPPLEVFTYPMRNVDGGEDFEDWSLWDLQQRTALVQEFDRLADDIVTAGIEMAEKFEVREEIFSNLCAKNASRDGVRSMKSRFTRLLYPKTLEDAQNGSYTIALFRPRETVLDGQGQKIASFKAVGYYLPLSENVTVNMTGRWRKDPKYGLQFEMESYEEVVESGKKGMVAYLSSGLIRGIGPKLAGRIYDAFGDDALHILDQDPERIREVPGVGKKKCVQFATAYVKTRGARKVITLLASLDVSASQAVRLWKDLGFDAESILRHQPYSVFEDGFISFELAERLARREGIPPTALERICAALLYVLRQAEQKGHLCIHKELFIREPVMVQMAWFRLKYPEGWVAVSVAPGKDCFVVTDCVCRCFFVQSESFLAKLLFVKYAARLLSQQSLIL